MIKEYIRSRNKLERPLRNEAVLYEARKMDFSDNEVIYLKQLYSTEVLDKKGHTRQKWQNKTLKHKPAVFLNLIKNTHEKIKPQKKELEYEHNNWKKFLEYHLSRNYLFIWSDFAMNISELNNNANQNDFMDPLELQLLSNVVKFKDGNGISKVYAAHIGDNPGHDGVLVSQAINDI